MSERRDGDAPSDFHENLWTLGIKDHNDQPVEFAWVLRNKGKTSSKRPSLPFQVYILDSAPKTGAYVKLPELFARWMDWGGIFETSNKCTCHFEVYRTSFANVLACVEHQRREIEHRNSKDELPHLVANWADIEKKSSQVCAECPWNMGYILVIDRDDWTTEGVLQVTFVRPPHSEPFVNHGARCSSPGSPNTVLATRDGIGQDNGKFFRSLLSRRDRFGVGHKTRIRIKEYLNYDEQMTDAMFLADCARSRAKLLLNTQIPGLMVKNHFDDTGWPALYASLNQEKPKDASWTLDIVWLVANISTAKQHYSQEARRWPSRRVEARHCLAVFRERVFRCAVGHILPEEILQNIIDLSNLRQPTKEDFDSTYATSRHVFMYLDTSTLGLGPQIAVADPRVSSTKVIEPETQQKRWCRAPWVSLEKSRYIDMALEVSHWRSWTAVANGLHTLWTIQGSRRTDIKNADLPYFTLKVQMPATCSPVAYGLLHEPIHSDFQSLLTLHNSAQEVAVKWPVLPESVLFDYLTVTDSETGQELDLTRLSKVERSDPPSPLKLDLQAGWSDRAVLKTFHPGQPTALGFQDVLDEWWYNFFAQNELVDGRSYIVSIREGLEIQRWTYGTSSKLKGPFNLPAVGVRNGDEVSSFVYRRR